MPFRTRIPTCIPETSQLAWSYSCSSRGARQQVHGLRLVAEAERLARGEPPAVAVPHGCERDAMMSLKAGGATRPMMHMIICPREVAIDRTAGAHGHAAAMP